MEQLFSKRVQEMLNSPPVSVSSKSMRKGLAISNNCLSTKKIKPSSLIVSSVPRGSSRAMAREGVPHSPLQGIILTADDLFLLTRNAFTISFAFSVISNIVYSLNLHLDCSEVVMLCLKRAPDQTAERVFRQRCGPEQA